MAQRGIHMTFKPEFRRSTLLAAAVALPVALALTMLAASPARADRCDDLAGQLKSQIDGLAVGKTAANLIYLSGSRKPKPAFVDLAASAAAIIFTMPKDDMLRGATRCVRRMGLLHGDDVKMRYRRLDMRCSRTKTDASIAISRGRDE